MSLPITVLCGLNRTANSTAGRALLADHTGNHLVTHCLDQIGVGLVSRTVQNGGGSVEACLIDLAHGCVSCTLREDVLPTLQRMARDASVDRAILVLPEAVEPIHFLDSFMHVTDGAGFTTADVCHIDAVVAVLEPAALVPSLNNHESLADRGLGIGQSDDRGLGDLLVGQIECADMLLAPGATEQEQSLLTLLNPDATIVEYLPAVIPAVFDFPRTSARTTPALVDSNCPLPGPTGAWVLDWANPRPLHPLRLHDALPQIADAALRGRGHFRVATRPSVAVEWDSIGGRLRLGAPDVTPPSRAAQLRFIGVSDQQHVIAELLDDAVLTDAELAAPASAWPDAHDPFTDTWLAELGQVDD